MRAKGLNDATAFFSTNPTSVAEAALDECIGLFSTIENRSLFLPLDQLHGLCRCVQMEHLGVGLNRQSSVFPAFKSARQHLEPAEAEPFYELNYKPQCLRH